MKGTNIIKSRNLFLFYSLYFEAIRCGVDKTHLETQLTTWISIYVSLSLQESLNVTNDIYYEILKERRLYVEILKIRREKQNWMR
jgi:hypothetical protein